MKQDKAPYEVAVETTVLFKKDNTVIPLSFRWTDGNEYIISKIISTQRGASLKKQGGGTRYNIRVEQDGAQTDNYLFRFGDQWFFSTDSGGGYIPDLQTRHKPTNESYGIIIDKRYDNRMKVPVDVKAICHPDGRVEPILFVWEDGSEYPIDLIVSSEKGVSLKAGITGIRYSVRSMGKIASLYRDDDLWFMERKGKAEVFDIHGNRIDD